MFENLKKSSYFKFLRLLKDKSYLNFGNPFINIDGFNITSDKIISLFDLENIEKAHNLIEENQNIGKVVLKVS